MCDNCRRAVGPLTLLILLVGSRFSPGQDVPTPPDPEIAALDAKIKQFLEGVSMGQGADAYDELLAGSRLKQTDKEKALQELIAKTDELKSKYGEYRGFEKAASKRIGRDLALFRYLYKCQDYPVVWYFTFYRAATSGDPLADNGVWRVIAVRFDTRLDLLWF